MEILSVKADCFFLPAFRKKIPMATQNSIMKNRIGEVRLPSDHKMKIKSVKKYL